MTKGNEVGAWGAVPFICFRFSGKIQIPSIGVPKKTGRNRRHSSKGP